jgi:hypothetical protein
MKRLLSCRFILAEKVAFIHSIFENFCLVRIFEDDVNGFSSTSDICLITQMLASTSTIFFYVTERSTVHANKKYDFVF